MRLIARGLPDDDDMVVEDLSQVVVVQPDDELIRTSSTDNRDDRRCHAEPLEQRVAWSAWASAPAQTAP